MKAYLRMISGIDHVVGRVHDKLKKLGIDNNTIIIFTGDNGYYAARREFAGKWSHYEESLRVPLVIYDPRKPQKHLVVHQIALNIDLPATMLDLAGLSVPKSYQGKSLSPLLKGKSQKWREDSFHEHLMNYSKIPKWEGVRNERYVYANYFQQDPPYEFLHDLKKDPHQLKNFVDHPEYKEILVKLRKRSTQLRNQVGGEYSLENYPSKIRR
jgi:arylsulfatase A-like enzyme